MFPNSLISRLRGYLAEALSTGVSKRRASWRKRSVPSMSQVSTLEDRILLDATVYDFGDAPSSYPVTLAENGARHTVGDLYLGAEHDEETDGLHSDQADADDMTGVVDDEDGVKFSAIFSESIHSSLTVTSSGTGKIDAWLDVNQDGDWLDTGEKILDSVNVVQGGNLLEFDLPEVMDSGTMFARVRLSTAGGLDVTGAAVDGEVEDYRVFVQPPSPTITGPESPLSDLRPTLTWTEVPGATAYRVIVTNLSTNTANYHLATVSANSYTPSVDFGIGQYSYKVQSVSMPDDNSSYPSPAWKFQIRIPVADLRVTSALTTLRPALQWDALPGAAKYDLWVDNLTTGQMQVIRNDTITRTSYTAASNLPFGDYRAWIRGLDASGLPAAWSAALEFSTLPPAPLITKGQNPAYSFTPTFAWNAVAGATSYDLVIRNLANGSTYIAERNISSRSWTPPSTLPDGDYRWWLIAISPDNIRGTWTEPHDFTLRTVVTGIRIISNDNLVRPVLGWNAIPGATRYDVWIDNLTRQQSQFFRDENVTTNMFSPSSDMPYGAYQVWVRALDSAGLWTPWTVANISTKPRGLLLLSPSEGELLTDHTPTFVWTPDPGAAVFEVVIRDYLNGRTFIEERNIVDNSWTPTTPMPTGEYLFWVRGVSSDHIIGEWSDGGHPYFIQIIDGLAELWTPLRTPNEENSSEMSVGSNLKSM